MKPTRPEKKKIPQQQPIKSLPPPQVLADTSLGGSPLHLQHPPQRSTSCLGPGHSSSATGASQDGIHVRNLLDGESLSYSLALVRGRAPLGCTYVRLRGGHRSQQSEWPVVAGEFRLLIELQRGPNRLELEAGGFRRKLHLVYEPRSTRLRVTPVYVICAGHDGYFQVSSAQTRVTGPIRFCFRADCLCGASIRVLRGG